MADLPKGALEATDQPDSPVMDEPENTSAGLTGATCTLGGYSYPQGGLRCVNHEVWECRSNGQWLNTRRKCD